MQTGHTYFYFIILIILKITLQHGTNSVNYQKNVWYSWWKRLQMQFCHYPTVSFSILQKIKYFCCLFTAFDPSLSLRLPMWSSIPPPDVGKFEHPEATQTFTPHEVVIADKVKHPQHVPSTDDSFITFIYDGTLTQMLSFIHFLVETLKQYLQHLYIYARLIHVSFNFHSLSRTLTEFK